MLAVPLWSVVLGIGVLLLVVGFIVAVWFGDSGGGYFNAGPTPNPWGCLSMVIGCAVVLAVVCFMAGVVL